MKYYGNYAIEEVENMTPYERDIYFTFLINTKEEEAKKAKQNQRKR